MASEVDIANLALARLGDRAGVASLDPPDGSAQADHCARFYPLARDIALEHRPWTFNTVRQVSNALLVSPQPGWEYAYAKPNDCLNVLAVVPPFTTEWWARPSAPFKLEIDPATGVELILTDAPEAAIIYQKRITDASRFPPQFVSALAWLLASYLAGAVVKGDAGRKAGQACYGAWQLEAGQASTINANQGIRRSQYIPEGMRARSVSFGWYAAPDAPVSGPYGFYAFPDALGPING